MLPRVSLQQLSACPFDCQKMKTGIGFSDLDSSNHIWMLDAGTVLRLSNKTGDSCAIVPQLLSENLKRDGTVSRVHGSVDCRSPALTDLTLHCVPGYL